MPEVRTNAVASPSPWGGADTAVEVAATERTLTISAGDRRLVLAPSTLSGTAGVGVLRLAGPDLPGAVELDFRTRRGVTVGATAWASRYGELGSSGFRDTVAALEAGGADLSLHGVARAQRGTQSAVVLGTAWLLAFFEAGVVGFGADFAGRAVGGHLAGSPVLSAILAILFALLGLAAVLVLPWHALGASSRAAASTPTAHLDDMTAGHGPSLALNSATLPFLPDPPAGSGRVWVVSPWLPRWRLPAVVVLFVVGVVGSAIVPRIDEVDGIDGTGTTGTVGAVLGGLARLGLLIVFLAAYYLRDPRVVAVDARAGRGLRRARAICYLASVGAGIVLAVLYRGGVF